MVANFAPSAPIYRNAGRLITDEISDRF